MKIQKLTAALGVLCASLLFTVSAVGPARIARAAVNMSTVAASGNYLATPTAPGFESVQDKLGAPLIARFTTTCVLPAYTETGSAGSEVLTANANGALSTSCADGVTGVTGDKVLLAYNETSTPDAGLFTLTQGTGGTPWVLTRTTTEGANTAARLQGSAIRVTEGFEAGLWQCSQNTITVGTTPVLWRPVGEPSARHGFYANAQFSENFAIVTATAVNSGLNEYQGWLAQAAGTGASIQNTSTGEGTFSTGTTTTGTGLLITSNSNLSLARLETEFGARWSISTVSDGTNTYSVAMGLSFDANNFSRMLLTPTAGANIDWQTTVASVGGATRTLCTGCFAVATTYRVLARKPFGATTYQLWFDPGTGVLAYINDTPAIPTLLNFTIEVRKSASVTARTMTVYETWASVYDPKAFGG
jgi:hypothetical protein